MLERSVVKQSSTTNIPLASVDNIVNVGYG
jgi:hypothetical protein